jgi:hypothetical protein
LEAHSRFIPVLIYPWYGENKNKNLYYTYIQPKIQAHTIFIYYQWVYVQNILISDWYEKWGGSLNTRTSQVLKNCIHQSNTGIKAWALELGKM